MIPSIAESLPPAVLLPDRVFTLPGLRYPRRLNVGVELLDVNADGDRGGRPAVVSGPLTLTYGALARRVNRLAHGLRATGLEPGDRVLLRLPNVPDYVVSYLACQKLGAITVGTMPMLRARELATIAEDAGTTTAIVWGGLREELERARARVPQLARLIVAGEAGSGDTTLEGLMTGHPERFTAVDTARDDVAMIAYTSGSTGVPKGCVHFHRDVLASADAYARHVLAPDERDRFGGHPPLAFTFGTGGLLVFPFRFGAATVLSGPFAPESMLETLAGQRVTIAFCAPTSYRMMLAVPGMRERFDLGALRLGVSAAEPLPAATWEAWRAATGVELLDGIGSTEMFQTFLSNRPDDVRYGSTGKPVAGYELRIVDENGRDLPDGEIGELIVRGPSAGEGYWNQRAKSRRTFAGEWTYTGDKYLRDPDGYYHYCGRTDDMFKVSGMWVSPFEVEAALASHEAVLEAAVIGKEDADGLIKPKAFIVLRDGYSPDDGLLETLRVHVKERAGLWKYPRWIDVRPDLPRTATGKIQRFKLREAES
jgi:benzoate-CoA ligase family protein